MAKLSLFLVFILQGICMIGHGIENGVYVAALTPLNPDLSCHHELLAEHCLKLIEKGCKGVVLFGTTGEGCSFSIKEKKQTLEQVIVNGLDSKKIIIANGSACLQDTIDLASVALENDCLAYLVAPPCFFKNVTEEGVLSFYRKVIQQVADPRLKIILYHIPQYTGVPITVNIAKTLFNEFPRSVIGIKESEGNLSLVKEILAAIPTCQVFVGNEEQIPLAVKEGASGTICGMANLWPEIICSVYEKGDISELKKLSAKLKLFPFIPGCKALLSDSKNPNWNLVRPPLILLTVEETILLKQ